MEDSEAVIQQQNREDFGKSEYGMALSDIAMKSALSNPKDHHELVRRDVSQVICAVCDTEQQTRKEQFHCDDCGICRVGGREKFFHCKKCGKRSDYLPGYVIIRLLVGLHDNHLCVENSMKNHCPICYEYLFDSIQSTTIMRCGHTMHKNCFDEMLVQNQYRCPICSKSVCDMSRTWERLDEEVQILCNDCNSRSEALFHIFGHKCRHCNSYNTRVM
ncbi:hypothetical protein RHMOL_Rhmol13G0021100 [Rhododendron molle]|uniref:Uncharacterized protein n=1 Tax=Rhododendron molle TaxID=49168 RepID=A0ACC0L3H7_RHOML|nr:hypothetical protein RHMOL_Rhmol13G0021100 [Rhododendron molle]